ncbi:MAG: Maf family protein [Proteobacteria bacterium]|nr:Maf family protein [Pseudomonadota bacterium]
MKNLILASRSPRRKQLLKNLGVTFMVAASGFKEMDHASTLPEQHVMDNALGKAHAIAHKYKNALVIGADTVVVYRKKILEKPKNMNEAIAYLNLLQGKTHAVFTGLVIIDTKENKIIADYAKTLVTMRTLNDREIQSYLKRIKPLDKAGAYAIQGAGSIIVEKISGCYYNVVGFPLAKLEEMLLRLNITLFDYMNTNHKRG